MNSSDKRTVKQVITLLKASKVPDALAALEALLANDPEPVDKSLTIDSVRAWFPDRVWSSVHVHQKLGNADITRVAYESSRGELVYVRLGEHVDVLIASDGRVMATRTRGDGWTPNAGLSP